MSGGREPGDRRCCCCTAPAGMNTTCCRWPSDWRPPRRCSQCGTVLENGMPRFFRRLAEGVFDEADLRDRVDELAEFLTAAEKRYQVEAGTWTAIGFSNGANVASALLIAAHLQQPDRHAGAVSTIWRILSARGFVTPQPRERPKSSSPRR